MKSAVLHALTTRFVQSYVSEKPYVISHVGLVLLAGTYALIAPHWLLLISLITILLMTIETLIATNIVKRGDYVAA